MKKFTSIAIAFLLALSVVPAMAADQTNSNAVDQTPATFQAFSNLSAPAREAITPLTDKELAAIEGTFLDNLCVACVNIAVVTQTNVAVQSASSVFADARNSARQKNDSSVRQRIN